MTENKALIEDILELLRKEVKHEVIIKVIEMRLKLIEGDATWKKEII
jgi:hypothetical protein